jgi:hypothetical protein
MPLACLHKPTQERRALSQADMTVSAGRLVRFPAGAVAMLV